MRTPISSFHSRRSIAGKLALGLVVAGPALFVAIGCSDGGPARQPVSGTITVDGKPLASGSITFAPLDGTTAATAEIRNGDYRIDQAEGPAPGRYQVEISAVEPTGKRIQHPDLPSEQIDEVRNIIPPKYNIQTQLAVEVRPNEENAFPFDLSTRKIPARTRRR